MPAFFRIFSPGPFYSHPFLFHIAIRKIYSSYICKKWKQCYKIHIKQIYGEFSTWWSHADHIYGLPTKIIKQKNVLIVTITEFVVAIQLADRLSLSNYRFKHVIGLKHCLIFCAKTVIILHLLGHAYGSSGVIAHSYYLKRGEIVII